MFNKSKNGGKKMEFPKDFKEKGLENLGIMEESGFLKEQGYVKKSVWKIIAVILAILFIGVIGYIGYQIKDGKLQANANPNLLCESQTCTCPEQVCNCGNVTCEPAIVNITINPALI